MLNVFLKKKLNHDFDIKFSTSEYFWKVRIDVVKEVFQITIFSSDFNSFLKEFFVGKLSSLFPLFVGKIFSSFFFPDKVLAENLI